MSKPLLHKWYNLLDKCSHTSFTHDKYSHTPFTHDKSSHTPFTHDKCSHALFTHDKCSNTSFTHDKCSTPPLLMTNVATPLLFMTNLATPLFLMTNHLTTPIYTCYMSEPHLLSDYQPVAHVAKVHTQFLSFTGCCMTVLWGHSPVFIVTSP